MILTARHLLAQEPNPSNERIREHLNGNLCRCGCYPRIEAAVAHGSANDERGDDVRLVTYDTGAGTAERVGVLRDEAVIDCAFEGDMIAFIEAGDAALAGARAALSSGSAVAGARLRAPLRPRTLRDFLTFPEHTERSRAALGLGPIPQLWYEVPAYYKGLPDTVIGPEEEIPWPVVLRSARSGARDRLRDRPAGTRHRA